MKAVTICVVNQKGGVGKSTTAHALSAGIALKGYKVLTVDADAQGNLSYIMGADVNKPGTGEVLRGQSTASDAIQHIEQGDIIASSVGLIGADMTLTTQGKEYLLKEALQPLEKEYDYIIIDTPPAMGILSINALTAAAQAIITVQADILSLQGVGQFLSTYELLKAHANPKLKVSGILLTRYNNRAVLSRNIMDMAAEAAEQFNSKVFRATIREAVAIREAQISQCNIFDYAPKSKVAQDYMDFVEEVLQ